MSNPNKARETYVQTIFQGVDITKDIRPFLLSATYTDNEEDETDDLQIKLQDRDDIWLQKWLSDIVGASASDGATTLASDAPSAASGEWAIGDAIIANGRGWETSYGTGRKSINLTDYESTITHLNKGAPYPICVGAIGWFAESQVQHKGQPTAASPSAAKKGFAIEAMFVQENWTGGGKDRLLECGTFELDSVDASGPPNTITLKASALPYTSQIRQTEKSRAWENYTLKGIANEMAKENGMTCMYLPSFDPAYSRVEQFKTSDIAFLSKLCHEAGISLKVTNNLIVLFDQVAYEAKGAVLTIKRGGGAYIKHKLGIGQAETEYASCRVGYTDPGTGKCISATAKVDDYNAKAKNNQQLEITEKVANAAEAKAKAEKLLRLHNKYAKTASFTLPGNPNIVAGQTVVLADWGAFDGKYIVSQAKHTVSSSGYTTQIKLRKVLEGY